VGRIIPYMEKQKKKVWNHQPVNHPFHHFGVPPMTMATPWRKAPHRCTGLPRRRCRWATRPRRRAIRRPGRNLGICQEKCGKFVEHIGHVENGWTPYFVICCPYPITEGAFGVSWEGLSTLLGSIWTWFPTIVWKNIGKCDKDLDEHIQTLLLLLQY